MESKIRNCEFRRRNIFSKVLNFVCTLLLQQSFQPNISVYQKHVSFSIHSPSFAIQLKCTDRASVSNLRPKASSSRFVSSFHSCVIGLIINQQTVPTVH